MADDDVDDVDDGKSKKSKSKKEKKKKDKDREKDKDKEIEGEGSMVDGLDQGSVLSDGDSVDSPRSPRESKSKKEKKKKDKEKNLMSDSTESLETAGGALDAGAAPPEDDDGKKKKKKKKDKGGDSQESLGLGSSLEQGSLDEGSVLSDGSVDSPREKDKKEKKKKEKKNKKGKDADEVVLDGGASTESLGSLGSLEQGSVLSDGSGADSPREKGKKKDKKDKKKDKKKKKGKGVDDEDEDGGEGEEKPAVVASPPSSPAPAPAPVPADAHATTAERADAPTLSSPAPLSSLPADSAASVPTSARSDAGLEAAIEAELSALGLSVSDRESSQVPAPASTETVAAVTQELSQVPLQGEPTSLSAAASTTSNTETSTTAAAAEAAATVTTESATVAEAEAAVEAPEAVSSSSGGEGESTARRKNSFKGKQPSAEMLAAIDRERMAEQGISSDSPNGGGSSSSSNTALITEEAKARSLKLRADARARRAAEVAARKQAEQERVGAIEAASQQSLAIRAILQEKGYDLGDDISVGSAGSHGSPSGTTGGVSRTSPPKPIGAVDPKKYPVSAARGVLGGGLETAAASMGLYLSQNPAHRARPPSDLPAPSYLNAGPNPRLAKQAEQRTMALKARSTVPPTLVVGSAVVSPVRGSASPKHGSPTVASVAAATYPSPRSQTLASTSSLNQLQYQQHSSPLQISTADAAEGNLPLEYHMLQVQALGQDLTAAAHAAAAAAAAIATRAGVAGLASLAGASSPPRHAVLTDAVGHGQHNDGGASSEDPAFLPAVEAPRAYPPQYTSASPIKAIKFKMPEEDPLLNYSPRGKLNAAASGRDYGLYEDARAGVGLGALPAILARNTSADSQYRQQHQAQQNRDAYYGGRKKKPLWQRLEEQQLREDAEAERKRQQDYLAYKVARARAQPTKEEIEEHMRVHDEAAYAKLNRLNPKKILKGGVNNEPFDLIYKKSDYLAAEERQLAEARRQQQQRREAKEAREFGGEKLARGGGSADGGPRSPLRTKLNSRVIDSIAREKDKQFLAAEDKRVRLERMREFSDQVRESFAPGSVGGASGNIGGSVSLGNKHVRWAGPDGMGYGYGSERSNNSLPRPPRGLPHDADGERNSRTRKPAQHQQQQQQQRETQQRKPAPAPTSGPAWVSEVLESDGEERRLAEVYEAAFTAVFDKRVR